MKSKGTRTERELFHLFWNNGWACTRAAGSGSTTQPSPDLIAGNQTKTIAIECKAIKGKYRQLNKEEIDQLILFSKTFGAEPWLAVRFNREAWHFLNALELPLNKNGNYSITLDLAKERGVKSDKFMGSK